MIKQTNTRGYNLQGFKKGLVKALCILFSNLKFKIQWKSASNSWPKRDTIRKTIWNHKPPRILTFAFAQAKRGEVQLPHLDEYLWLQNGQEERATVTFLECNLPPLGSTQATHTPPPLGLKHNTPLDESELEDWSGNRDLCCEHVGAMQKGEKMKLHAQRSQNHTAEYFSFLLTLKFAQIFYSYYQITKNPEIHFYKY